MFRVFDLHLLTVRFLDILKMSVFLTVILPTLFALHIIIII